MGIFFFLGIACPFQGLASFHWLRVPFESVFLLWSRKPSFFFPVRMFFFREGKLPFFSFLCYLDELTTPFIFPLDHPFFSEEPTLLFSHYLASHPPFELAFSPNADRWSIFPAWWRLLLLPKHPPKPNFSPSSCFFLCFYFSPGFGKRPTCANDFTTTSCFWIHRRFMVWVLLPFLFLKRN